MNKLTTIKDYENGISSVFSYTKGTVDDRLKQSQRIFKSVLESQTKSAADNDMLLQATINIALERRTE